MASDETVTLVEATFEVATQQEAQVYTYKALTATDGGSRYVLDFVTEEDASGAESPEGAVEAYITSPSASEARKHLHPDVPKDQFATESDSSGNKSEPNLSVNHTGVIAEDIDGSHLEEENLRPTILSSTRSPMWPQMRLSLSSMQLSRYPPSREPRRSHSRYSLQRMVVPGTF